MGLAEPKSAGASGSTVPRNPAHLGGLLSKRRTTGRAANSLDVRRRSTLASTASLLSEDEPGRSVDSISCVNRETSKVDCARQKFIVWAAIKRNRSVRMAASERLRCPLLRCGEQFSDHETMLRHLTDCRHFSTGEYVCYECMRVERLKDAKCSCCLGHPTKRRRVINMAKNFFSHLGHKSTKDSPATSSTLAFGSEEYTAAPPPRYDSLPDLDIAQSPADESRLQPELSGSEILEMEAEPLGPAQLDSINYETQDRFDRSRAPKTPSSRVPRTPVLATEPTSSPTSLRPALALDTHNLGQQRKVPRMTYLSPSSSLRSTSTSQDVSPISAGSGIWSSIGTNLASPITPFSPTDLDSGTLSRDNSCKFPKDYAPEFSALPSWIVPNPSSDIAADLTVTDADNNYTCEGIPELPGDDPRSIPRAWGSDPLLFCFEPKDNYSWSSTVNTEVNVLFTGASVAPEVAEDLLQGHEAGEDRPSSSETKSLVHASWDALQTHISTSLDKIETELPSNRVADSFKHINPQEIALSGLRCLRSILSGVHPTDPIEYLCFVHLVYSFYILICEDDLSGRCHRLFSQALAYRSFLNPTDVHLYIQLVETIWQPRSVAEEARSSASSIAGLCPKGKQPEVGFNPLGPAHVDSLLVVAQDFLDDLEMSAIANIAPQPDEVITSELYSTHISETEPSLVPPSATDAFVVTVNCVIQMLLQSYEGADVERFSRKLRRVARRVTDGRISSVRRLELELLQAGKETFARGSTQLLDEFIPLVRQLCDPLYEHRGAHSRTTYHMLGVTLVESLIRAIDRSQPSLEQAETHISQPFDFDLDIPDGVDPFAEFLKTFDNPLVEGTSIEQSRHDAFAIPSPTIDTARLHLPEEQSTIRTGKRKRPIEPASEAFSETLASASAHGSTVDLTGGNHDDTSLQPLIRHEPGQDTATVNLLGARHPTTDVNVRQAESTPSSSVDPQQRVEANSCCEICGYRPKGDPQWFKGSMAKHKKLQHSTDPPKIYKCPFPGCPSAYKNRPDNLRQHQLEKGHFVDGDDDRVRRPAKRKKMS